MMLSLPPEVIAPETPSSGPEHSTASAWSMLAVMDTTSASNFVPLGHMSRCRRFTCEKRPKISFRKA